ncbi:MAG TPA: DUF4956 domain-containing protein [Nitrospinota bacterium]|jgi:uncharacterized membrane protein YhiD involved in acid resistance|nr:DUF4956 domain-containing protein [Nitrospinota bacterium]|tara:strand:- start:17249 stop:17932 length:684 start_codon:yes stop_codon:yes gene_type:complete
MAKTLLQVPQYGIAISHIDLMVALALSLLIGLFVILIYQYTHRGLNYEKSFLITLVMMAPIIAVVMMLIGSNLALSLGMVGALSIIRFRTVIKDSRDMIYLFWAIAIGLGCGTHNWLVIVNASFFIGFILCCLHYFQYGKPKCSDYVLVISGIEQIPESSLRDMVKSVTSFSQLRSMDVSLDGWEMVFEIRFSDKKDTNRSEIVGNLKNIDGVHKISLLAPQLALPV